MDLIPHTPTHPAKNPTNKTKEIPHSPKEKTNKLKAIDQTESNNQELGGIKQTWKDKE